MYVYSVGVFLVWVMLLGPGLTDGRRLRRESCKTYQHEGKACCVCPKGWWVLSDCTDTDETKCELCVNKTFMNHPNSDHKCYLCKTCDPNANMKVNEECSSYSDTVCGCEKGYYCDKGDHCRICIPCDTCEEHGVKEQCTDTNNTVCHDAKDSTGTTAATVVVVIVILGACAVGFLWRKKKFCFEDSQSRDTDDPKELLSIDLSLHLAKIADLLDWNTMKRVARHSGMDKKDIEEQEMNHPNDVRERTFTLLEAWNQKHGLEGSYSTLIKTLQDIGKKTTADKIQKIVVAQAQP